VGLSVNARCEPVAPRCLPRLRGGSSLRGGLAGGGVRPGSSSFDGGLEELALLRESRCSALASLTVKSLFRVVNSVIRAACSDTNAIHPSRGNDRGTNTTAITARSPIPNDTDPQHDPRGQWASPPAQARRIWHRVLMPTADARAILDAFADPRTLLVFAAIVVSTSTAHPKNQIERPNIRTVRSITPFGLQRDTQLSRDDIEEAASQLKQAGLLIALPDHEGHYESWRVNETTLAEAAQNG